MERDGIYLILLTITWHLVGVFGVLIWLGYVGITEDEIRASLKEIDGHYGMFVVFIMKHVQAELTQQVESDVLLFCSVFYFIIGTAGKKLTTRLKSNYLSMRRKFCFNFFYFSFCLQLSFLVYVICTCLRIVPFQKVDIPWLN